MNEYIITILQPEKYTVSAETVEEAAAQAKQYMPPDAKLVSVVEFNVFVEESKAS